MISRMLNPLTLLQKNKSILLLGPRGTGKTALIRESLKQIENNIQIDLLRGDLFRRYLHEPILLEGEIKEKLARSQKQLTVSIDEIQKVPALLDEVHRLIEGYKNQLVFLLSGSSARKLKRGGANLLAGRAVTKELHPISQLETELNLLKALNVGTLPGIYFDDHALAIPTLDSYVSTYLREEIQQESLVRGIDRFSRFLEFAAQLNGEPANFAKLGKQVGIAGKTAQEYFMILVDTLIVHELPGWSQSIKKQLVQAPKYYFFDCGILNALNGYLRVDLRQGGFLFGKLFETFVINQLFSTNEYHNLGLRFFYWRDKNGREVDLVLARNVLEPVLAIEIKSNSNPSASDCSGLKAFEDDYPKVKQLCVCTTPRAYKEKNILFTPWQEAIVSLKSLF